MGHAFPTQHAARQQAGLRALAQLVNEALALRVTQWTERLPLLGLAPAMAGVGPLPGQLQQQTTLDAPQRRHAHIGRPSPGGRRPTPTSSPTPSGEQHDDDPTDDELSSYPDAVDDSHVEVWQLVERAQAGDGEAFGQLYDRYVDSVFRFIYYRVNDRALAEDFTSETFLRALRRITTVSYQGRDIGAWFVTIARNIVLDHVKSARNRLEVTTAEHPESKEHEASTEAAVLESLQSEQLLAAIAKLGDEQRECVTLRFLQGLSVGETAAAMGKNDGAIKALQHRAVRKLADLIGDDIR